MVSQESLARFRPGEIEAAKVGQVRLANQLNGAVAEHASCQHFFAREVPTHRVHLVWGYGGIR